MKTEEENLLHCKEKLLYGARALQAPRSLHFASLLFISLCRGRAVWNNTQELVNWKLGCEQPEWMKKVIQDAEDQSVKNGQPL